MKNLILVLAIIVQSALLLSQAPQGFNYQAILRNSDGTVKANETVALQISIVDNQGVSSYLEIHNIVTNEFGYANVIIGGGTSSDNLSSVDWANGPYFLDITVNGVAMGSSPLLSVPYALFANTVENITEVDGDITNEIQNLSEVLAINNDGGFSQIKNIADPTDAQDAATKAYVDILLERIQHLESLTGVGKPLIAYIYKSNTTEANAFKLLLESNNFNVDLIDIDYVSLLNFNPYKLVIIGSETSSGYDWGTPQAVNNIKESGKLVLGLGFGGASFFEQYGLSINWSHSVFSSSEGSIIVMNTDHRIFVSPNTILIDALTRMVSLYNETSSIGEYRPNLSSDVVYIGRLPSSSHHYSLVAENGHWLWGFNNSPTDMTTSGKNLFVNIVSFLSE